MIFVLSTTLESTTQTVRLDPEQFERMAEMSQGNTYAILGLVFVAVMVLTGIFVSTMLR